MNRRIFLCGLTLGTLSAPLAAGGADGGEGVSNRSSLFSNLGQSPVTCATRSGTASANWATSRGKTSPSSYWRSGVSNARHGAQLAAMMLPPHKIGVSMATAILTPQAIEILRRGCRDNKTRSSALRDPRGLLARHGIKLPDDVELRIYSAKERHLEEETRRARYG